MDKENEISDRTALLHNLIKARNQTRVTGARCRLNQFPPRDTIASVIACIGALSMGFALGYSSPALRDETLENLLKSEDNNKSWFGSLLTLGAVIGGPAAALCVGNFGRKVSLILCNVPLCVGWFLIVYSSNVGFLVLFIGRILVGFGIGAVTLVVPLYVSEIATTKRRGALGSLFQLFISTGIFLAYTLGTVISWTWLAITGSIISLLHEVLMVFVPETPRWLLAEMQTQEAVESLTWLRGPEVDIGVEFAEIEKCTRTSSTKNRREILSSLLRAKVYKPLFISSSLMILQQLTGISAVVIYASDIFYQAGYHSSQSIPSIIIGAVLVTSTMLSCVLVDAVGRRMMLILSGLLMAASSTLLGIYFYLMEERQVTTLRWLFLVSLLIYIIAFSIGWGPVPSLVMSELKGYTLGIAPLMNWLATFLLAKEYHNLTYWLQIHGAFWMFGSMSFLGVLFVVFLVPETKGKTIETIQSHFEDAPR